MAAVNSGVARGLDVLDDFDSSRADVEAALAVVGTAINGTDEATLKEHWATWRRMYDDVQALATVDEMHAYFREHWCRQDAYMRSPYRIIEPVMHAVTHALWRRHLDVTAGTGTGAWTDPGVAIQLAMGRPLALIAARRWYTGLPADIKAYDPDK
jgi:hypothetical protein